MCKLPCFNYLIYSFDLDFIFSNMLEIYSEKRVSKTALLKAGYANYVLF